MKKIVCFLLMLIMIGCAATAFAATGVPGDVVSVTVSITSNPDKAISARVGFSFDSSLFEFVGATKSGDAMRAPGSATEKFGLLNLDGMSTGSFGTLKFKIKEGTPAGTYSIGLTADSVVDYGRNPVDIIVSAGSITVKEPVCDHVWDEGVVTTEATCVTEGVRTYTCQTNSAHTKTEVIPVSEEHDWDEGTVVTEAACGVAGVKTFKCKVDGCTKTYDETLPAKEHAKGQPVTVPADCEVDGSITISCTECGEVMDVTPIPATGHDWDKGNVTTEPTCTEPGVRTFTCANNSKHTKTEDEPATGEHVWSDGVTTEATCTEDGKTVYTCTYGCGETKEDVIPSTGHDYKDVVTTPETCGDDGVKTFTCENCGDSYTETIPANGKHTYQEGADYKAPTCTEDGYSNALCTVCGQKQDGEILPATGHEYEFVVTTEPTCEAAGVKTFTCKNGCGETYTEDIPALGHEYDEGVETTPATCGTVGVKTFTCKNGCGKTYTEDIPALGHDYDEGVVTTPATCGTVGVKTFTCANDATHTYTEEIPATGEHTWDEGVVTTVPTCTETGVKTFTCTVCGETDTEEVAATGHTYEEGADYKAPTCTEDGFSNAVCSACGLKQDGEILPATGHKYEGAVTTEPTCEEEGVETFTCTACGDTYTDAIDAIGHLYDGGVVTTEPTCTEEGVKTFTCKNDASHTYTEPVAAKGHVWGDWIVTKPADEEDGEQQRTCEVCGEIETKVISAKTTFIMTTCSKGIRFRDLENPVTDYWYMFTPIDLSVEGEQTFDLIAGNIHKIGTVTVVVKEGTVTVSYKLFNRRDIEVFEEFMTILPALADVTELDFETMTNYAYGEAISIEEQLGGDTKVLLLLRNLCMYTEGISGIEYFDFDGEEYLTYAEELKQLMD